MPKKRVARQSNAKWYLYYHIARPDLATVLVCNELVSCAVISEIVEFDLIYDIEVNAQHHEIYNELNSPAAPAASSNCICFLMQLHPKRYVRTVQYLYVNIALHFFCFERWRQFFYIQMCVVQCACCS